MRAILLISLLTSFAFAEQELECLPKTLVTTDKGQNYERLEELTQVHREYVTKNMKDGTMLFGGPIFNGDDSAIAGGLLVFETTDFAKAAGLMDADPYVSNKVITYTLKRWLMCSVPK